MLTLHAVLGAFLTEPVGHVHFIAWRGEDYIYACDIKSEHHVWSLLSCLLPYSECPVCLEPLADVQHPSSSCIFDHARSSVSLFSCMHLLHPACWEGLAECPVCRNKDKTGAVAKTPLRTTHFTPME